MNTTKRERHKRAPGARMYQLLEKLPWLRRSFKAKVLSITFLGIHVPLLAILAYFAYNSAVTEAYALRVLITALAATLACTLGTLLALRGLMWPLDLTLDMLDEFRHERELTRPDVDLQDEMGTLINGTAETLTDLGTHLEQVAMQDQITGALNALGMEHALSDALRTSPGRVTLVQMRVRDFSRIAIGFSREENQFVMRTIADRLRLAFPEPCRIAVLGRGQFALLIVEQNTERTLETRLDQAIAGVTTPIKLGDALVTPICAMGVASADGNGCSDELFSAAESAVSAAEEHNSSAWVRAADLGSEGRTSVELMFQLDLALEQEQLFPVYQPRLGVDSGRIESLEALVRWRHPERGVLNPDLFIPMAEHTDKIRHIGRYMTDQAVAQAAAWNRAGRDVGVSVNVAAAQIAQPTLVDDMRATLERHGLPPRHLELEITETTLLHNTNDTNDQLQRIRDLGVAVALDDFGTGYSSLNYLSTLAVDRIKIDRTFVSRLHNPRDYHLVAGLVQLARALGLAVTAEGVETPEQANTLRAIGCDQWQGFLFAYPAVNDQIDWQPRARPSTRATLTAAG